MVCVRLCDGYHFPLTAGVDKEQAAFACKLGCPGAETKVFRRQGDDINNAVADDRSVYKKLANASAFQKSSSATCGCFSTRVSSGPVYDDPTMRPGDVIIVDGKAMTLKPGATKPYDKTDYVEVERSRSFPASVRNMLRAKLQGAPIVARAERRDRVRSTATPDAPLSLSPSHTRDGLRVIMPSPYDGAPVETPPGEAPLKQAAVSGNSGAAPVGPLEPAAR
nr:DUF2865 domain-containing protein [Variibacter gotjawalensis]